MRIEPVFVIAIVHVEREHTESRADEHRVKGAFADRRRSGIGQPTAPQQVQLVVKPIHRVGCLDIGRWKAGMNGQSNQSTTLNLLVKIKKDHEPVDR